MVNWFIRLHSMLFNFHDFLKSRRTITLSSGIIILRLRVILTDALINLCQGKNKSNSFGSFQFIIRCLGVGTIIISRNIPQNVTSMNTVSNWCYSPMITYHLVSEQFYCLQSASSGTKSQDWYHAIIPSCLFPLLKGRCAISFRMTYSLSSFGLIQLQT